MTLIEFTQWLVKEIAKFTANLMVAKTLGPQSRKEWMKTFLDWMEWGTEMHDEYWPDED